MGPGQNAFGPLLCSGITEKIRDPDRGPRGPEEVSHPGKAAVPRARTGRGGKERREREEFVYYGKVKRLL